MQAWFRICLTCSAVAVALAAVSCTEERARTPSAEVDTSAPPPPIEVTTARADLVFSYLEEDQRTFSTATSIEDVPAAARRAVVVTDLSLSPERRQAGRYIYIADLRAPREDGSFAVALASRYGFETGSSTVAGAPPQRADDVVVYSASWCGACKKAKRTLERWSVPFTEKDIEASKSAARELANKAAANGFRPGGVPVIDVRGTILQGFDERSLRSVCEEKGLL